MYHKVEIFLEYDEGRQDEVEELIYSALDKLCIDETHQTCIDWWASTSTEQEEIQENLNCACECCKH